MTNSVSLIISLGREGKSPRDIARELHSRGVFDERGRAISPEMVSGFLRFIGSPLDSETNYLPVLFGTISSEVTWGAGKKTSVNRFEPGGQQEPREPRGKNRNAKRGHLSDDVKTEVSRLFQQEGLKPHAIAERLGVPLRKIYGFCIRLSGFTVPPGEIEVVTDANGQKVMKCPPGYALGAEPQRNVRPTQGGY
jgi:hypothetical protein